MALKGLIHTKLRWAMVIPVQRSHDPAVGTNEAIELPRYIFNP